MAGTAAATAEISSDDDVWEPDYSQSVTTLTDPAAILSDYQAHAPECILPSGYLAHPCIQAAVTNTNSGEMRATFVFVTRPKKNEPNRAGRMIQIVPGANGQGISFANYQQNPVVLFNHGFDGFAFPLGLSEDKGGKFTVKATKSQASADVYFNQSCPYAEDIFRMVDSKILRASSIGFNAQRVISMRFDDNSQLPPGVENCMRYGCDVVDSEMLEWSIVAVGADAGALRQCLETGKIAGRAYRPVLTQFLRQYAEPRHAWSPGLSDGIVQQKTTTQIKIGDTVKVKSGMAHDQMTKGKKGTVKQISTPAIGVQFDDMDEIHKWYVAGELEIVDEDGQQTIINAIKQGLEKGFETVKANLAAPVQQATIPQVNVAQAAPAVVPTKPGVTQQEFQAALQQQLAAVVSSAVQSAVQPVVTAQNGIVQRLNNLTGKLPD